MSIINRKIQEYEQVCENIFTKFGAENKIPTADEFRAEFNREIGREPIIKDKENTLFEVYDSFMEDEGKKINGRNQHLIKCRHKKIIL